MSDLRTILESLGFKPKSYEKRNKSLIVDTDKGKYVIKKNTNNIDIYNYLNTRGFYKFPETYNLNNNNNYDISLYIPEINVPEVQKIEDLIVVLSELHYKTSYYRENDLDEIKEIYESIKENLFSLLKYYTDINDYLDKQIFLSPDEYLLIRNISLIYFMINNTLNNIEDWYKIISENKRFRVSLIHNNISKDHLLINENKYLISWDKSKIERPIIDLLNLYKKYYRDLKLSDLFSLYNKNNCLDNEEKMLLMIYLQIPKKIVFTKNHLDNVIEINNEILYLKKVYEYIKNIEKCNVIV